MDQAICTLFARFVIAGLSCFTRAGFRPYARSYRVAAADFSRIRGAKLDRFTVDRLMTILHRLGREVEVCVSFRPLRRAVPLVAAQRL
ncbi:XRE family transcriptional regulator [Ferrovibrio sp.]|uniref:XRE family transcriptional regulator n=1 Tax=Ferrovibrio sp. TaxID=1917215 RepID=UPI0034285659